MEEAQREASIFPDQSNACCLRRTHSFRSPADRGQDDDGRMGRMRDSSSVVADTTCARSVTIVRALSVGATSCKRTKEKRERERTSSKRRSNGNSRRAGGKRRERSILWCKIPTRIFNGRLIPNLEEGNAAVFSTAGKSVGPYKFRAETGRALESVGKPPPAKGTGTSTL